MDVRELDLNLLATFHALLREGSVTQAGRKLGLSQPAISYALARLRRTFDDALFVRVGNRMQPTARAEALGAAVERVMDLVNNEILQRVSFQPENTTRVFTLCMSDVGESNFVAPLLEKIMLPAPRVDLRVRSLAPSALPDALAANEVDLAVGFFPDLGGGNVFQQTLFETGYVCAARVGNPYVRGRLTLARFLEAPHAALNSGTRSQGFIERDLRAAGIQRRIRLTVQHFMSLIDILPRTDLIAVMPLEAAQLVRRVAEIEVHRLPYPSSRFLVKQHWHRKHHHDPANQWLRGLVREQLQSDARSGAPTARSRASGPGADARLPRAPARVAA